MKQRNHLLALVLLTVFIGVGVIYFHAYAERKPFGIILFVGEGVTSSRLTAARLYEGGADHRLAIQGLPNVALLSTHSADFAVPDAASAASALACGAKVNNGTLALDPNGQKRGTLLELARQKGRSTGLVTNGRLTDPTPAAFYAHSADYRDRGSLATQLAAAGLDVMLGGGRADFEGRPNGPRRDGRNLVQELTSQGYHLLTKAGELAPGAVATPGPKLLGLFAGEGLAFSGQAGTDGAPRLSEMVRTAIETLQKRAGGYVLVVDAGLIGKASVADDGEHALQETLELDRAVELALQYAGEKTLVVLAGGESTGGMALNGYPLRQDHGVSLLGMNAAGFPSLTWSTGPAGPMVAASGAANPTPTPMEPAAFGASYAANVADDAVAAGFGPGSERLRGFLDNTFVFELIKGEL